MRVLVRVPEAYALLAPYETTRPGLLVLDADGRRIDSIDLAPQRGAAPDADTVARRLREAAKAPVLERWRLRVTSPDVDADADADVDAAARFRESLAKLDGVASVRASNDASNDGLLLAFAPRGTLRPEGIALLASSVKAFVEIVEPVPVAFSAATPLDTAAAVRTLAAVAGTWCTAEEKSGPRAWVTALLLDPARLEGAAKGFTSDVEAMRFDVPGVSLGPPGMRLPAAARGVAGGRAAPPAPARGPRTLVGRRGGGGGGARRPAVRAPGVDASEAAR